MDSLFGIPLTSILAGLLAMLAVAFGALGWIAWRSPLLVRMGLRNVRRRKSQTSLIVTGLMLSTLIISAAFATGDTVGYSVTNTIYASFEEVGTPAASLVLPGRARSPMTCSPISSWPSCRRSSPTTPKSMRSAAWC